MIEQKIKTYRMMIGHNIKTYRKKRSMTQAKLASIIGIDRTVLSRYENDGVNVSMSAMILIARALKVSPLKLMEGA